MNCSDVARDFVPRHAVATGGGTHKSPFFIEEGYSYPIHLRLDRQQDLFPGKQSVQTGNEFPNLFGGVCIVETLHRHHVLDLFKGTLRSPMLAPHPLRRGVCDNKLRMGPLQINQFPIECIILTIRDLRFRLIVVETVVMRDPAAKFPDPFLIRSVWGKEFFCGHRVSREMLP